MTPPATLNNNGRRGRKMCGSQKGTRLQSPTQARRPLQIAQSIVLWNRTVCRASVSDGRLYVAHETLTGEVVRKLLDVCGLVQHGNYGRDGD
jgi:hypothetical protein